MLQYLLLRQPKYRRVAVLSPQACLVRTMNLVAFMAKQSQVIRHFRGSCAPRVLRVLQCTFHSVMWPLGALIKHVPTRATNHVVRPFENVPKIRAKFSSSCAFVQTCLACHSGLSKAVRFVHDEDVWFGHNKSTETVEAIVVMVEVMQSFFSVRLRRATKPTHSVKR